MLAVVTDLELNLLTARWDTRGIEGDFEADGSTIFRTALDASCWLWLIDLRHHGDLTRYSASNFFRTRVVDTAWRAPEGQQLRVALLLGPGFLTVQDELPDADYQQRHHFTAQVFTDEGIARQWLMRSE